MKILFLSALYPPVSAGGGEISTHLIAQGLLARGHDVSVVSQGDRASRQVYENVPVQRLPLPLAAKPLWERAHARRLAAGLREKIDWRSYDIIHAHDFRTTQVLAELIALGAVTAGRALVTTRDYAQICGSPNNLLADGNQCPGCEQLRYVIHNQAVVEAPLWRRPFRIWQYWHNIGYRLRSFAVIPRQIFISQAQRHVIASRQKLGKIETSVIYNPVATDYLKTSAARGNTKNILYVGTLNHYKGVPVLLEAFAEIARTDNSLCLMIAGRGPGQRRYEHYVKRNRLEKQVRFLGHQVWHDLGPLYDAAQVVVAPHIWIEPFGRTVAEALARGKIVITSNRGGPTEMIADGERGFLVEPGDARALAAKLDQVMRLSDEVRAEIGRAAKRWAADNLSLDRIAAQYEQVYLDTLRNIKPR